MTGTPPWLSAAHLATDLDGAFWTARAAIPHIVARKGVFLFISSVGADLAAPGGALDRPGWRIQRGESRLDESMPILTTEGEQAAVEAARDDDTVRKCLPELGRKSETVLVIDRVLVSA